MTVIVCQFLKDSTWRVTYGNDGARGEGGFTAYEDDIQETAPSPIADDVPIDVPTDAPTSVDVGSNHIPTVDLETEVELAVDSPGGPGRSVPKRKTRWSGPSIDSLEWSALSTSVKEACSTYVESKKKVSGQEVEESERVAMWDLLYSTEGLTLEEQFNAELIYLPKSQTCLVTSKAPPKVSGFHIYNI